MTIYEFTALDINARAEFLWKNGIFLDNYLDEENAFNIYFLKEFFVEVIVSKPNDEIINVVPFKAGYRLDKYLERIIIS
jgi:hypothetical protein